MTTWARRRIRDLIDGLTAGVSVRSTTTVGGPAILKTSAVDRGRFMPDESKSILPVDIPRARCNPTSGGLIISRMNTPAMVGDVGYVPNTRPDLFLPDRLWLARAKPGTKTDMRWLTYYFASDPGARELRGLATGTSGSMKNIPKERVLSLEIDVPSEAEQTAIAQALSDADELISALELAVSKKRWMFQGMVQGLVSGRTQLPGFEGKWAPVRLRDAGGTYGGLAGKTKDDFGTGSASFITFMQVMARPRLDGLRLERVHVRPTERQNRVLRGDVLFNGSSETPEEVALAAVVDFDPTPKTFLNSFSFGYRLKDDDLIDPTYLAYFFRSGEGRKLVSALAQGATRYNIAKTKLMECEPLLPPVREQRAIATVLRDAEDEIDGIEARLAKARAIKTGMMQQLLTGRTRLPMEAA